MLPALIQARDGIRFHRNKSTNRETNAYTSAMLMCRSAAANKNNCHPNASERYTDEVEQIQLKPQRRIRPLLWLGVFGIFLILGWFGLSAITSWYQGVQNDL